MTDAAGYRVLSADADKLAEQAEALVAERQRFRIEAGPSYRHRKALTGMLRDWNGEPGRRGFWRSFLDAMAMGDIISTWSCALRQDYRWRYEVNGDRVAIVFDPPAAS